MSSGWYAYYTAMNSSFELLIKNGTETQISGPFKGLKDRIDQQLSERLTNR